MNNDISTPNTNYNGKTIAGIILLALGGILLIQQFDLFFFPNWIFSWPMLLIAYGTYIGAKHHFRKTAWVVLVLLGFAFLLDENIINAGRVIWPVALMALGCWIAFKPAKQKNDYHFEEAINT